MKTKTAPTLATIERLFDEVDEWYGRLQKIRQKLGRLQRGSEAYLDLLPDLWTEADVLGRSPPSPSRCRPAKAQYAAEMLDEFEESLTDD
jgi:hypothetical protein